MEEDTEVETEVETERDGSRLIHLIIDLSDKAIESLKGAKDAKQN